MAQRGNTAHTTNPTRTDPRFSTFKFNDQTMAGQRGSLGSFNFDTYARRHDPGGSYDPNFGFNFDPTGSGYVGDKGTTFKPHVPDVSPPKVIETVRRPDRPQKDDAINPALAFAGPVAKKPTKSVNAISEFLRKKPVVARRQPGTRGVTLTSQAGMGGGGISQNPNYRNTPGSQTYGIYPQTGSQQDYSLHYPDSYTYKPTNY